MRLRSFGWLSAALMVVFFLALQGCTIATQDTAIMPPIMSPFQGKYTVDPYLKEHRPHTVAVLPFTDKSGSRKGNEIVRRGFYNHFSSLPYKDLEIYRVDILLKKAGHSDPEAIGKMTPQDLGKILGVDAVIYGEVSDFDKLFLALYSQVSVGAELKMFDTKTGHFLWSGQHVTRIHEGGLSTTPVGIIATIVATSMNMRDIQLLRACDDLFRDMVKTIPAPTIAEAVRPPVITLLTQDSGNRPRKAGDEIKIVIQGDPKMRATFDIGDFKKEIEMREVEPGGYLGVYKVIPGDNVKHAILTGHLIDDSGNRADWVDAIGMVTLDTTPPAVPVKFETVGKNQSVLLKWAKNKDDDLAGYRLYRSASPLSGYVEVAKTEVNELKEQGLVNFQKYYYKLSAFDEAGNESEKAGPLVGMPVAPGPTPVAGAIESDTVWYSGASPYVIEGPVTIKDKAVLTIEAGTEIRSKGPGITVEGQMLASGDKDSIIRFDAQEGATWEGIRFSGVKDRINRVKFARISRAQTGITCLASSPQIEDSEFTENTVGIFISGAFSKPEIVRNAIHHNKGGGISAVGGSQPVMTANTIRDNEKTGIMIAGAAPIVKQNTVVQNNGPGIKVKNSQAVITANNIHDNRPLDLEGDMAGSALPARDNWWGTADGLAVLSRISGRVDIGSVLSAAYPAGKPVVLPVLPSILGGEVKADGFLILSNSPYSVKKEVVLTNGAVLHIEPGVRLQFDPGTSIIVKDGGIMAKGLKSKPIVFTAAGAAPGPGAYTSAVRFTTATKVGSFFEYCIIKFAAIGFDIHFSAPDISYCQISNNAQAGIFCGNDAAPKISFSTFSGNRGEGAIKSVGMSKPVVTNSNFLNNDINFQAFSSIYLDARNNWWGKAPPDKELIWGEANHINTVPFLQAREERAFFSEE